MWRQYRTIEKGEFMLFAGDTASGGGDNTTIQTISKNKIDCPLVYQSGVTTSDFIPELVRVLEAVFDFTGVKPVIALERNNGGSFLMDKIAGLNLNGKYIVFEMPKFGNVDNNDPNLLGWNTNSATRPVMISALKDAVERQLFKIYDKQTVNEMLSFVVVKTSSSWKAQAEKKAHDDLVMALAIAWQMFQKCEPERKVRSDYSQYENYKQPQIYDNRGFLK
jgi:hypothetical protein